jgi:amino acid adenylation domain-containing protein
MDALQDLVARHEALRGTFSADGLTFLVAEDLPLDVPLIDLSALAPADRESRFAELLATEVEQVFDLERGPLVRFRVVRHAGDDHRLVMTAHHIVCDGWSTAVLMKDLGALYSRRRGGAVELPPAEPFSAYARAQADAATAPERASDESFWLERFSVLPADLDLPADRPRPRLKTYASRRVDHLLEATLVDAVKRAGARAGASFFTTLLAGFKALLHRLTQQDDLVVAIPAAGQSVGGHATLVGHCVNTLPLRTPVDGGLQFASLLRAVRTVMLDAYEHQQVTLGALLGRLPLPRDPGRLPLVSVLFNVDQALGPGALRFEGLEADFQSNPRHFENFDLFVNAVEQKAGVVLEVQYNSDLFDAETVRRWMGSYEQLLRSASEDPSREVGALDVLTPEDQRLIAACNATAADYERHARVHELVEEQAGHAPDAPAVSLDGRWLDYGALNGRANRLARELRQRGVRRGTLVGLCMERSPEMLVGLLAILKAGAAYVPLDPSYPADRLAFMVQDSGMPLLVTESPLASRIPASSASMLLLDADAARIAAHADTDLPPEPEAGPEDVAYVIYTSGSTGTPKGVLVPHRAVVNFLASVRREPGLAASDTLVAVTTLSFDIAVLELLLPLTVGARIVLASRDVSADGGQLASLLEQTQATVMQATPSTWRLLIASGWSGGPGFKVICGGEALPPDLAQSLVDRAEAVWNMYGPTETTVWSTVQRLAGRVETVPIGRPLANTQVYVLDPRLRLVPPGVTGELHVGGDGVTRGYLGRPELTSERFLPDPFVPGGRLYRTGDLARLRVDGVLEYLGRNDTQVKVRGFRIELGEIERTLAAHPGVRQAVVSAREIAPGDVRLVAYVVPRDGAGPDHDEVRRFLGQALPEYMLPQHVVQMPSFPLTPNGKIDRKALPAPTAASPRATEYVEPRTDAERKVARLWQEALGVARLSADDNFFHLGGHSLLASQVLSRLRRDHGVVLSFRTLFEAPTVERFAALVEAAAPAEGAPRIPRRGERDRAPVTVMQQRLLLLEEMDPRQRVIHTLSTAFRLRGALDQAALERCLERIVARHDVLRSRFSWENGVPIQSVRPPGPVPLPVMEWGSRPADDIVPFLREAARQPLDLEEGPLFQATLIRMADEDHVFAFRTHNAVWDGWSFDLFRRELAALYAEAMGGPPARLPDLPVSYGDFAAWHRGWLESPEILRQTEYWQEQLAGPLPVLELPTDRPRGTASGGEAAIRALRLSPEEVQALTRLGRDSEATLFMVLLAAFNVLLWRYSGQRELVVGTPVRARTLPEIENLIGAFVNALVLRSTVDPAESFREYLARVRATTLDAFSHQEMPFELLRGNVPVLRAFFSLQDVREREQRLGGVALEQLPGISPGGATDITLWVMEQADGIFAALNYRTDLFDAPTMAAFMTHYHGLLASAVTDPAQPVGRLSLLGPGHEDRTATTPDERPATHRPSVHDTVARHASARPDAIAAEGGGRRLTFAELHDGAARLAGALQDLGVGPGSNVGICVGRSPDLALAIVAVLMRGAACVPLDAMDPPELWTGALSQGRIEVLVTDESFEAALPVRPAHVLRVAQPRDARAAMAVPVDGGAPAWILPSAPAAGRRELVAVSHGSLATMAELASTVFGVGPASSVLAVSPLSQEGAVSQILVALLAGARLVLAEEDAARDGAALAAELDRSGADVIIAPRATIAALGGQEEPKRPALAAICTGAPLRPDEARRVLSRVGRLGNAWGSAESGLWTTAAPVASPESSVVLGRPPAGVRVLVVDESGRPLPPGVPGEAAVERADVAPELRGRRLATGERVRQRPDGTLLWLGRQDGRLAVQGVVFDPAELEPLLVEHDSVADAVLAVADEDDGREKLIAFVVGADGREPAIAELRRSIRRRLPDALVPASFITIPVVPRRPDGSADRAALPTLASIRRAGRDRVEPRTPTEQMLASIWKELLGAAPDVHDNFFDLGGHSLLATMAIHRVQQKTGHRLSLRALMFESLGQMAHGLDGGAPAR